jgi:hypothetical protein
MKLPITWTLTTAFFSTSVSSTAAAWPGRHTFSRPRGWSV